MPGIIGIGFAYVLNYQIITSEGAAVRIDGDLSAAGDAIVLGVLILILNESATATVLAGIVLVVADVALTRKDAVPTTRS